MQPRTLDAILGELSGVYNPQEELLRRKQADIPGQVAAEEQGLRAQEQDYYDNTIMGDARRRGVAFGGIPIGERARYGSTQFLPALARLRQSGREQAFGLEDALLQLNERKRTQGQSIYEGERNLSEQQRQFNENLAFQRQQAAAQRAASGAVSAQNDAYLAAFNKPQQPTPRVVMSKPGSFTFYDPANKPITAAKYAQLTGQDIRDVLYGMGQEGDKTAQLLYNQILAAGAFAPDAIKRYAQSHPYILGGV